MTFHRLLLAAAVAAPLLAPAVASADAHITITQVHELADALTNGGRIHRAVEFEYGKRRIYSKTREELAEIAKAAQAHPNMKITVEGHGFAVDEETSISLGEKRADLVRTLLIRYGAEPENVTAVGASRIGEPGRYVDLVIEHR